MINKVIYQEISRKKLLVQRLLSILIDASLALLLLFLLIFIVGEKVLISMLYTGLSALIINVLMLFIFQGQSFGQKMAKLQIIDWYGGKASWTKKIMRQFLLILYWMPFINLCLFLTNIISYLIYKDKMIHDFITKTKIINQQSIYVEGASDE